MLRKSARRAGYAIRRLPILTRQTENRSLYGVPSWKAPSGNIRETSSLFDLGKVRIELHELAIL